MLKRIALACALLCVLGAPALAQNNWSTPGGSIADGKVDMCLDSSGQAVPMTSGSCAGAVPVSGSFSASLAGFAPGGAFATVTSTASSADAALPAGLVVVASNSGTSAVSCNLTSGAGTSTANKNVIQPASWVAFTVGTNTHISCINQAGDGASNVVVLSGGTGLATGSGGGSGGGGGGGAVTVADGADITQGAKADSAYGGSGSASVVSVLKGIYANGGGGGGGAVTVANGADTAEGTTTNGPCTLPATTTACTMVALAKAIANASNSAIQAQSNFTTNIGQVGGQVNITPTDCSVAITTGGTAQNIIAASAGVHGFTIANIDSSAGSGEPVWMSFTTTAAPSTLASYPLAAPTATTFVGLSSYTTPLGFGVNHAVSVIAATTGHKISCTTW